MDWSDIFSGQLGDLDLLSEWLKTFGTIAKHVYKMYLYQMVWFLYDLLECIRLVVLNDEQKQKILYISQQS